MYNVDMKIGGFMKQSFVDFPGLISSVIFTDGCNLNCWYCHNCQLIKGNSKFDMSLTQIYDFLNSRKGFIDGVVISGGEPTLQSDLLDVIQTIKNMGFQVKLDTNGTNPIVLDKVIPFVDYVAMDIKNSFENYSKTVGAVNVDKIKQSIDIIKSKAKDYEFRTTFAPEITLEDIEKIGKYLVNVKRFSLQTYNKQRENDPEQSFENYEKAIKILKNYISNVIKK